MRRFISILIVAVVLFSVLGLGLNSQAALREKKGNVAYGTPAKIDGVWDDCYKNSTELVIAYMSSMANSAKEEDKPLMATGSAWLCWDENAMYIYVKVVDKTPVTKELTSESSDGIEVFFDFDNSNSRDPVPAGMRSNYGPNGAFLKTAAYARTVGSPQHEFVKIENFSEYNDWLNNEAARDCEIACVITSDGYIIERKMPFNESVKALIKDGFTFGFQIAILDDIDDNSQRDFKVQWGESVGGVDVGSWGFSASCDELTLLAKPAAPPPTATQAPTNAPSGNNNAGGTGTTTAPPMGDSGVAIIFIVSVAALSAAVVFRRKTVK